MRILIVTDQFPPYAFGGMAQHAWHIAHQLSDRHTVRALIPRQLDTDWRGVPFDVFPTLSVKFPVLDVINILWNAHSFEVDVVHVCNAALSYALVSRSHPVVTRVVGNDFLRPWCGYRLPLRPLLVRLPGETTSVSLKSLETRLRKSKTTRRLRQVDAVAANSEWTKSRLIEEGISEKCVHVVTGGVDIEVFKPSDDKEHVRQEIGIPEGCPVVLTAANLVMKKGIDTVLRAIAELASKWPKLRYVIVGEGRRAAYLQGLAADLEVCDRVTFTGRKTQEELCRYYQAADVYVQISRNHRLKSGYLDVETMGRTYMEAGACGLPVVAASTGGVPSVVKDKVSGLLVDDPLDLEDVAEKIDRLLADAELRRQMGEAGLDMAREQFSWEQVAARFEDLMIAASSPSDGDFVRG